MRIKLVVFKLYCFLLSLPQAISVLVHFFKPSCFGFLYYHCGYRVALQKVTNFFTMREISVSVMLQNCHVGLKVETFVSPNGLLTYLRPCRQIRRKMMLLWRIVAGKENKGLIVSASLKNIGTSIYKWFSTNNGCLNNFLIYR